jgi:hypothetical protein
MKKLRLALPKASSTLILVVLLAVVALFFLLSPKAVNPLADLNPDDVDCVVVTAFTRAAVLSKEQQNELIELLRQVECTGNDTGFYMGSAVACTLIMKDGRNISIKVSGYYYKVDDQPYRIKAEQGDAIMKLILSASPTQ